MSFRSFATALWFPALASCSGLHFAEPRTARDEVQPTPMPPGVPPLVLQVRSGDPVGAVAVAVNTASIAPRDSEVAVALAAVVETRLRRNGLADAQVAVTRDGYSARVAAANGADAAIVAAKMRDALSLPIAGDAAALRAVGARISELKARSGTPAAMRSIGRCLAQLDSSEASAAPSAVELEAWRKSAHSLGRIGFSAVGGDTLTDAVTEKMVALGSWPSQTRAKVAARSREPARDVLAEPSRDRSSIAINFALSTEQTALAANLAKRLKSTENRLASRLRGADVAAQLTSVTATANSSGGCLALHVELDDVGAAQLSGIGDAVAIVRQEIAAQSEAASHDVAAVDHALNASDPRDAASAAAWWSAIDAPNAKGAKAGESLSRDLGVVVSYGARRINSAENTRVSRAIRAEIDRGSKEPLDRTIDLRTRVERGQRDMYVLVGSPCGVGSEADSDTGVSALFAMAAAENANGERADAIDGEGWASIDGVGVVVHGAANGDESSEALAARLGEEAMRRFAVDPIDRDALWRARIRLRAAAGGDAASRSLPVLARLLAPSHPSLIFPFGSGDSALSISDAMVMARARSVRGGPIRIAVIANEAQMQGDAAARAAARWLPPNNRRPCPAASAPFLPKPGAVNVPLADGSPSELRLVFPIDREAINRKTASLLAMALDGAESPLARTLAAISPGINSDVQVVGDGPIAAIAIRITGADGPLGDTALAAARLFVQSLRGAVLTDSDRSRAISSLTRQRVDSHIDPRNRLVALWRGIALTPNAPDTFPTLADMRNFAAQLRDDSAIVVVGRPEQR